MSADAKKQLVALYQKLEKQAEAGKMPLAPSAEDIVPGEGDPNADVLFIGEAPGFHEQQQRRPFVGRSGKLLRKVIAEIDLAEDQVYIANIVKARPPENRDPSPAEIEVYKEYLDGEIEILQPKLIVTLGRFSMAKFLHDVKISQVHGRLHKVTWGDKTLFVLPQYHPAAALRGTKIKNAFTDDMKKIPKVLKWLEEQKDTDKIESQVKDLLF